MSSKTELIKKWHTESWANPPASISEASEKYLSEDYKGYDTNGNVISDKETYIKSGLMLYKAFSGFKGILHNVTDDGESVIMTFHFEGTHTGDLDLSSMGLGVIPASGKKFVTAESKTRFVIKDDLIVSSYPISGGFESLLVEIGAIPASA